RPPGHPTPRGSRCRCGRRTDRGMPAADLLSEDFVNIRAVHELRSVSRRDALKYAAAAPLLLGLPAVAATLGAQTASADNLRLTDFTERLVPPDQLKSAGFDGALVYVSELRPRADFDFKPVTREYANALRAAGMHVVSCYPYRQQGWAPPSALPPPDRP